VIDEDGAEASLDVSRLLLEHGDDGGAQGSKIPLLKRIRGGSGAALNDRVLPTLNAARPPSFSVCR
jgi:hypothetical protein